jgi:hypothetical protein
LLNPDFAEMLSELSAEGVQFLLVGAYALAAHGLPRATGDIDIWVRPSEDNGVRVLRALQRFGAPLFDLTADDLARPGTVFQMGLPPRRIDILTAIDGVEFDDAWTGRLTTQVDGIEVSVIGRDDLMRNKRAAGRPKDLVDVEILTNSEPSIHRDRPPRSRGRKSRRKR